MSDWQSAVAAFTPRRWSRFNEATGATTIIDYGTDGANGTVSGFVSAGSLIPSDPADGAWASTATSAGMSVAKITGLLHSTTFLFWAKAAGTASQYITYYYGIGTTSGGFAIIQGDGNINGTPGTRIQIYTAGNLEVDGGYVALPDTNPHLVGVFIDANGHYAMGIDGTINTAGTATVPASVGGASDNINCFGQGIAGTLDDFVVLPSLLSQAQFASLYGTATTSPPAAGLSLTPNYASPGGTVSAVATVPATSSSTVVATLSVTQPGGTVALTLNIPAGSLSSAPATYTCPTGASPGGTLTFTLTVNGYTASAQTLTVISATSAANIKAYAYPLGVAYSGLAATIGATVYDTFGNVLLPHTTGLAIELGSTGLYSINLPIDPSWNGYVVPDAPAGVASFQIPINAADASFNIASNIASGGPSLVSYFASKGISTP